MNYLFYIGTFFNIYLLLVLGENLLFGNTGLLFLAPAAFFGTGAYLYYLFVKTLATPWPLAALASIAGTSVVGYVVGMVLLGHPAGVRLPLERRFALKKDYYILASLAVQIAIFEIFLDWVGVTGGPMGLRDIPSFSIDGIELSGSAGLWVFSSVIVAAVIAFLRLLNKTGFGVILSGLSQDEILAQSVGKNTVAAKLWAHGIAGGIWAMAGILYAGFITYIDPFTFDTNEALNVLMMLLIGGVGTITGPALGVFIWLGLGEALRFSGISGGISGNIKQMILASILILLCFVRPQGLWGVKDR